MRMLSLNETSHSMLLWDTQKFNVMYRLMAHHVLVAEHEAHASQLHAAL